MNESSLTLDHVQLALDIEDFDGYRAQRRMAPARRILRQPEDIHPRMAAVLALLFPQNDQLMIVLTRRAEYPGVHSGQISFPGGRREGNEDFETTALRETEEELGIAIDSIKMLGKLTPLYVPPSNFKIHPFVGYYPFIPNWKPDRREVAEVIEIPLVELFDPKHKKTETRTIQGFSFEAPFYDAYGHKVWGATAIMLSEFEQRVRQIALPT